MATNHRPDARGLATPLAGERTLAMAAGTWQAVLEPIVRDTATLRRSAPVAQLLSSLDRLISAGLNELQEHPIPKFALHPGPESMEYSPILLASSLAAYRAERLFQWVELAGASLDALTSGSIQVAAVTARSLFEIAAFDANIHRAVDRHWPFDADSAHLRRFVSDPENEVWARVWKTRLGTRSKDAQGLPSATGVSTRLQDFAKGSAELQAKVDATYARLCEATHPNVEAQGVFWRRGDRHIGGVDVVRLAPGDSESPVKVAVIDALLLGTSATINLSRDLWRVLTATVIVCVDAPGPDRDLLGLPRSVGPNARCPCGSGFKRKLCSHPAAPALFSVSDGRPPR